MCKKSLFTSCCLFISLFLSNGVLAQQVTTGEFVQPQTNESFAGNLLFFVQASNEAGLASVAIRFPQRNINRTLCQSNTSCNGTDFSGLLSGFNPNDFGFSEGTIEAELLVTDISGSTVTADTISVNWSIPRISNVEGQRSADGSDLSVSWSNSSQFLRYNIYLAEETGLSPSNARSLAGAQVRLIRRSPPELFENLEPTQTYYILVTGIDASGESGLSEVIEVAGLNVPPNAENDEFVTDEDVTATFNLLLNDSDENGDELELLSISGGQGALEIVSQQTVSYTPPENFSGDDSFTYIVGDGNGGEASASVSITVLPINDAPIANADTAQTLENLPVTISVLENDSDIENDLLQISSVSSPENGDASSNGSQIVYTPNADFFGTDSFTYTVSDGNGGTASASVTVDIQEVNAAPVAQNDSAEVVQGTASLIDVLSNDSDPDGDELAIVSASAQNGTVVIQGASLSYTSSADFVGTDTILYTISDGSLTAQGSVSVTVTRQNAAPQANNDSATVVAGQSVTIDVLANDSDPDGDSLTITSVSATSGAAQIQGNQVIYTANGEFTGVATVRYIISDGELTGQASVTITVNAANQAPIAVNDTAQVQSGQSVTVDVLGNDVDTDGDALTLVSVSTTNGMAVISNNQLIYTAPDDLIGTVLVNYVVTDGELDDEGSVQITIFEANRAPIAVNDSASVPVGQSITVDVLANDSDPDNDPLTITNLITSVGVASIQNNQIAYTSDIDFEGIATVDYTISDGALTAEATLSILITFSSSNEPPVANDDEAITNAGASVVIDVLNNDFDPDDDELTITNAFVVSGGGSVSVDSGISLTYTPGPDSEIAIIEYTISDGQDSAIGHVAVTINSAPIVANDDAYTVVESATLSVSDVFGVLSNDTNQGNTATLISGPSHAMSFTLNPDGSFEYVHDGSLVGTDTFLYETAGSNGMPVTNDNNVSQALVTINIARANFLPQFCSVPASTARVGQLFTQTIEVRDEDGANTTAFDAVFPGWLTFADNFDGTATLQGTPSASDVGQFEVSVSATDGLGASATFNANYVVEENLLGFSDAFAHLAVNFGAADHFVRDMVRDRHGNLIVVGGDNTNRFIVARLTPTGQLDPSFAAESDVDGDMSADPGLHILFEGATSTTLATAVKVLDNDKIVVAGIVNDSGNEVGVALLNSDGTLDTTFGIGGIVREDPTSSFSLVVTDVEVTDNQYITVIGHFPNSNNETSDFFAAQYDLTGSPNLAFGNNGLLVVEEAGEQFSRASLQDQQGRIYILGSEFNGSVDTIVISRISSSGAVDLSFETNGVFNFTDGTELTMFDLLFDVDGGLLIAGSKDFDMAVARFQIVHDVQTGQDSLALDTSFGDNSGFLVVPSPSSNDRVVQLVADQQDGYFLLGQQDTSGTSVTAVAKMFGTGDLDVSYGDSGVRLSDASNDSAAFGSEVAGALNAYGQLIIAQTAASGEMQNTVRFEQFSQQASVTHYGVCDVVAPCVSTGSSFDQLYTVVAASNNELVAVGESSSPFVGNQYISLAKFNTDFVFDTEFGDQDTGLTTLEVDGRDLFVGGVSRSDNGDLVLLLESIDEANNSVVLAMYDANGQRVSSFGNNGVEDFADAVQGLPLGIAYTQADSRIVVASIVDDTMFEIRQFDVDGTPDLSFASSGLVTITNDLFLPVEMEINSLGDIYIGGVSFNGSPSRAIIAINKINSDGTVDTGFGNNGLLTVDLGDTSDLLVRGFEIVNNHFYFATIDNQSSEVRIIALDPTGAFDTSFNPNGSSGAGVLSLGIHSDIFDFTQDANGKLILGLDVANPGSLVDEMVKIDTAGRLDGRFINGGRGPIIGRPNAWNSYQHITALPTGELVLGGERLDDFVFAMTDQAGAVINTVHELSVDFGQGDRINAAAIDGASRLMLAGAIYDPFTDDFDAALRRVPNTGSIGGFFSFVDSQPEQEMFFDVTVGTDANITAFGGRDDAFGTNNVEVIGTRTLPNSLSLDLSFRDGGRFVEELSSSASMSEFGQQLVLDDGSIFVVGSIDGAATVAKFDSQGQLEVGFANSGILTLASTENTHFSSVALDGNGDVIAVGYQKEVSSNARDVLAVKFTADGTLDSNFGSAGIALFDFSGDDVANQVAIGPNGHPYIVGLNRSGTMRNTLVLKLTVAGQLDSSFGSFGSLISPDEGSGDAIIFDSYGAFWIARVTSVNTIEVARFNQDGVLSQNMEVPGPGIINLVEDLEIDALGNLYVVGNAQMHTANGNMWDFFSLRFPQAVGPVVLREVEVILVETVSD